MNLQIGTWNLAGRWDARHEALLFAADADVWLLTEVNERLALPGYRSHATRARMAPRRAWACVLSRRGLDPLDDPHPASAAARIGGVPFCSSVLPWRGCGQAEPWIAGSHGERTRDAVDRIARAFPQGAWVWGGDWNHALSGREHAGSMAGRAHVVALLEARGLEVPTARLPHRLPGLLSIDHIAIPRGGSATARRVVAEAGPARLSDHDAYLVDVRG
jgi:hypothetical protein